MAGLAVASRDDQVAAARAALPQPAVSSVSGWYPALAGVRSRPLAGRVSGCGTLLTPKTLGVDHPVLPCGAKIFVAFGGKTVLTTVVDRGPFTPRPDFEVTPALADVLGLEGRPGDPVELRQGWVAGARPLEWAGARPCSWLRTPM